MAKKAPKTDSIFQTRQLHLVSDAYDADLDGPVLMTLNNMCLYGNDLYILFDKDNATDDLNFPLIADEVWRFDTTSMALKNLVFDTKNGIAFSGLIVHNDLFYLFTDNKVVRGKLDEDYLNLSPITTTNEPKLSLYTYFEKPILVNNIVYVIGMRNNEKVVNGDLTYRYKSYEFKLNLETLKWNQLNIGRTKDSVQIESYSSVVMDGKIYFIGGNRSDVYCGMNKIYCIDTREDRWKTLDTEKDKKNGYPKGRILHAVIRVPNTDEIIMMGGRNDSDKFKCIWKLDVQKLKWEKLDKTLPDNVSTVDGILSPSGNVHILIETPNRVDSFCLLTAPLSEIIN